VPMLRAMLLEFPDDPACDCLDRQYMLGDSLLVAPVLSHSGEVDYYVPAGRWTNLLNGSMVVGPRWVRETHDFMNLPLLVRPNTVLPVGRRSDRPDYDYSEGLTLQVYELEQGEKTVRIPTPSGEIDQTFTLRRSGSKLEVERSGSAKPWQLLLVGVKVLSTVEDGKAESTSQGVLVTPDGQAGHLVVHLGENP
jgi:alpha-D-xyloside xylohydrolase